MRVFYHDMLPSIWDCNLYTFHFSPDPVMHGVSVIDNAARDRNISWNSCEYAVIIPSKTGVLPVL